MVKRLDNKEVDEEAVVPPLADHIGWLLWRASQRWIDCFVNEMQAAGNDWFGPAQARLMGNLSRQGTRQSALTEGTGLTKQAVQQLLDDLEKVGVVQRGPDPDDRRGRIVQYTPAGLRALADGDRIKRNIERKATANLSATQLSRLKASLDELAECLERMDRGKHG